MWTKTVPVKFKKQTLFVMLFLSDSPEGGTEEVTIQSMLNEYYLIEKVLFPSRDAAYDFIKLFTVAMASAFIIRTAYEVDAAE